MAADALQAPIGGAISLNPERTWLGVAEWLTIGQMFLLAFIFGNEPRRARTLVYTVGTAGAVYSAYGILDVVMGIDHILFVPKNPYTIAQGIHYVAATFINADHYAAFAGFGLIALGALSISEVSEAGPVRHRNLRRRLYKASFAGLLPGLLLVPCLIGLVMSTSRAGLASAFAGLLTLILLLAARNRSRRATIVVAAFLLAAFLVVSDMAGDALARRMGSVAAAFDDRLAVYSIVVEAIRSNPWTGFGLGAFEDLFPLYRDARAGYGGVWNAAHNSYLELMATLGIPAALAFLGSIAIVVGRCAAGAIIRRKDAAPALVATATTAQLGLHSLFDFPLQIQAIALFYAAILGAGLAQAYSSGDRMLASGKSMRRPS